MASFAEDKKRGTEVLYYTTPVDLFSVVAGKFLAAMALLGVMFINVIVHMIVTRANGGIVDVGAWGSVIVFFFMATMFVSIGLLSSSLNDNQIVSAIVSFIIILIFQMLSTISVYAKSAMNAVRISPRSLTGSILLQERRISGAAYSQYRHYYSACHWRLSSCT